ncbi:uncharacterized protein EMH_0029570 [Eimeria mitis]|uniref:Uncharacterized protein n=1 Tax=Eimeria mitis TaxID=44415 RepID=U6KKS0_9EIME|nr:uncharacterized protein EMH_0029570 [Eimeria mitis]CDJ36058.1 hypothetical protein, conserved [Eimeria mitis]
MMDEVRLSAAASFPKGGEVEAVTDDQQVVHAADFAAGGGVKSAGRHSALQGSFTEKLSSWSHGAAQSSGHGCIATECREEVHATTANGRECILGSVARETAFVDRSGRCGARQGKSSGRAKLSAEQDDGIFQCFGEDLVHIHKLEEPRKLGAQRDLSRSGGDTSKVYGLPEGGPDASFSVWQQRAPPTNDGCFQQVVESFGDGGKLPFTKFPGEHGKLYQGKSWHTSGDGTLTTGVLPSREDLVRRLLPGLPQNCAALLMKSSIEGLYDDSVAAVGSHACVSSPQGGGEMHTGGGDKCAGGAFPEEPFEESGRHSRTTTFSRYAATAPGSRDNERGAGPFHVGVKSDEMAEGKTDDADPFVQEHLKDSAGQDHSVFEETRQKALEALEGASLLTESTGSGGDQSEAVVYVVREEWEAFTLYYCSHTGVVRAVASEVSHVTARNSPPDLCRGLPTMAVGGDGCQQCRKQQSRPCSGWWRSRYVLLRVTVTLADRSSGGTTLQGSPASPCCEHGGSPEMDSMDSWSDGRVDGGKSGTKPHGSNDSSLLPQPSPFTSHGLGCHAKEPSMRGSTEAFDTQPSASKINRAALRQPGNCGTYLLLEESSGSSANRSGCEVTDGDCIRVEALKSLHLSKRLSIPSRCNNEAKEFAAELLGPACEGTDMIGDDKRTEECANELALSGGSTQAEVAFASFLKANCPVGKISDESPLVGAANVIGGVEASMRSSNAGDPVQEVGFDAWAANGRRSRLASLLSSPCDSFEGFVSSGQQGVQLVEKDSFNSGNSADCLPSLPYLWTGGGGPKPQEVQQSSISSSEHSRPQCKSHGETKFGDRGWQYSGAHRSRRRGTRRTFKSQTPPCVDSAGGARRALAQCYAVCASTIGMEAVAEAQNSYLGLCVEERELAAVFLDFVALVAPGAINASDDAERTGFEQRKSDPQDSVGDMKRAVHDHTRCKRKPNLMGRGQSVKKVFCQARKSKTDGAEDAACGAARLTCRRWDDDVPHCVGNNFEFTV